MARSSKPTKPSTKKSENGQGADAEEAEAVVVEASPDESAEPDAQDGETVEDVAEANSDAAGDTSEDSIQEDSTGEDAASSEVPGVIPAHVEAPVGNASPPVPVPTSGSGTGAMGMIFGGLVAGVIGFLVATFAVPDGWPGGSSGSDEQLSEQASQIAALTEEVRALRETPVAADATDLTPLQDRLSGIEAALSEASASVGERFEGLNKNLAELEERFVALEGRPAAAAGAAGSAALEAQLEQFRQQLDDVTADAEARIAEAQDRASEIEIEAAAAAAEAERRAALAALKSAVENGTAFGETLSSFDNPPEELSSVADKGVPTLAQLQSDFPGAARMALSEARSVPTEASTTERLTAFLKRQTNARSLAPKEGDDPDAVLSRAEAAISDGDLRGAIAEMSALPDDAQAAMSTWIAAAEIRASALDAVATLENVAN